MSLVLTTCHKWIFVWKLWTNAVILVVRLEVLRSTLRESELLCYWPLLLGQKIDKGTSMELFSFTVFWKQLKDTDFANFHLGMLKDTTHCSTNYTHNRSNGLSALFRHRLITTTCGLNPNWAIFSIKMTRKYVANRWNVLKSSTGSRNQKEWVGFLKWFWD